MNFKRFNGSTWDAIHHKTYDTLTESLTSFPAMIQAAGEPLTDYIISGNTVQNGTPTPDAPVDVVGCGVRTGNLFDITTLENGIYLAASGNKYGNVTNGVRSGTKIKVLPNTAYTLSAQSSANVSLRVFEWSSGTFTEQTPIYNISGSVSLTVTTTAETNEIAFNIEGGNGQYATNIMLNTGSTALPYEPYGYKLPITVNSEEYPIYLGQVSTTRMIKKYEFTGTEDLQTSGSGNNRFLYMNIAGARSLATIISDRYANANISSTTEVIGVAMSGNSQFRIRPDLTSTVDDFKSYLAQQYSAGTPVTVWYVLATPETGTVNEPLHKISDYADTITMAQAEVAIPTSDGDNIISFGTTVKPSGMSATFRGWHAIPAPKTYDGNDWR